MYKTIGSALKSREGYLYRNTRFHATSQDTSTRQIVFAERADRLSMELGSMVADCIVFANTNDVRVALLVPARAADDYSCAIVSRFSGHDDVMKLFDQIQGSRCRIPRSRECMDAGLEVFVKSVSGMSTKKAIQGALDLSRRLGCLKFRGWPVLLEDPDIRGGAYQVITAVNPQLNLKQNIREYLRQVREFRQHGSDLKMPKDPSEFVALEG
jgi:hypothetical protein